MQSVIQAPPVARSSLLIQTSWRDSPEADDGGGDGGVRWSGQGMEGSGRLKVKSRVANWGGSALMSFSVVSLPWTGDTTSLSCQSPSSHPFPGLSSPPPLFLFLPPSLQTEKKTWRKNCLFLNRPLNLFGLGVIGHLHVKHSEVSAITTGL